LVPLGAYVFPAVGLCDVSRWFFSKHSKKVVKIKRICIVGFYKIKWFKLIQETFIERSRNSDINQKKRRMCTVGFHEDLMV